MTNLIILENELVKPPIVIGGYFQCEKRKIIPIIIFSMVK